MAHVGVRDVQNFLEQTKLKIESVDPDLDDLYSAETFAKLAPVGFPVELWTEEDETPIIVRGIIARFIAAQIWERHYSENSDEPAWYSNSLRLEANALIAGLIAGEISLVDVIPPIEVGSFGDPSFWPTDDQETDGLGDERKFQMKQVW